MTKSESRASVGVIQSDREAACKFYGFDDEKGLTYWGNVSKHREVEHLARALAAYRVQIERGVLQSTSAHAAEPKEVVLKIAQAAHAIGWQAGVGAMETAGAIVSYLAKHQDQIEPFMAGSVSPVDWPDFVNGGCLTWHAKDGSLVHPSSVAAPPLQSPATGEGQ